MFTRDLENFHDKLVHVSCSVNMVGVNSCNVVSYETSRSFQDSIYGSNEQSSKLNESFEVDSVEDDEYFEDAYSAKSGSTYDEDYDMEEVLAEDSYSKNDFSV